MDSSPWAGRKASGVGYQLDFVTPGMRPFEASSRNVMREIWKRRRKARSAAGEAAAVHNACGAGVAGQLGKRGVVFFRFQFRAEGGVFFDCFLFALVALKP